MKPGPCLRVYSIDYFSGLSNELLLDVALTSEAAKGLVKALSSRAGEGKSIKKHEYFEGAEADWFFLEHFKIRVGHK